MGEGFPGGETVADFADVPAEAFAVPVLDEPLGPEPAEGVEKPEPALSLSKGQPSSWVQILAPSVAQRRLGASVVMRPSWALAGTKGARCGESRRCSRMRRRTRLRPSLCPATK